MTLRPVDEVVARLLDLAQPTQMTESRVLDLALGCFLARDLESPVDVPPMPNSAMDGYAVDSRAVAGLVGDSNPGDSNVGDSNGGDVWLPVSDRIAAGQTGGPLLPGTAARIFTGATLPDGADAVVIQEDTELHDRKVRLRQRPAPGDNVRPQGQDVTRGDVILQTGDRLGPDSLALVASVGIPEVTVYTPLKVAIMSTGDELVEPGSVTSPGKIYNSNRHALAGLLKVMGMTVIDLGIIKDTPADTETCLLAAAAQADCILTSGGVSVGEEDHVKAVVEKLGGIDIWKLAIKPGKPLAYGHVQGVPFFGLPGNPVSTFVTFLIIARPCLLAMQGARTPCHKAYFGAAGFDFQAGGRREYLRVRTNPGDDGQVHLDIFPNQGSGIMTSVVWADALAEVEMNQRVKPGDRLKFYPYSFTG